MRIAHVNQDAGITPTARKGAAVHVAAMRDAFRELGCDVIDVDPCDDTELERILVSADERAAIDLVYERYALRAFEGSRFAHARGIPHVLEVNAPLAEESELYRSRPATAVDARREREVFARAASVLAVSRPVARFALESGARPERITVEPNAVDTRVFRRRAAGDPTRAELAPEQAFVIGFHGRLRPWHNIGLLVDALERLSDLDVRLVALGQGPFTDAIAGRIPRDRVTVLDWMPHAEAARVVAAFDALPLTYAPDRPCYYSPLKLMEAMAVGAVPIVPRMGDLCEVIGLGARGLSYDPGDAADLARCVRVLIRDAPFRHALSSNAVAYARDRSWLAIARRVLERARRGSTVEAGGA